MWEEGGFLLEHKLALVDKFVHVGFNLLLK